MNWVFWAIIGLFLYTIVTLVFFSVYGYTHPKDVMEPKPTRWQSKTEPLIDPLSEKFGKVFGYMMAFMVVMNLLYGLAVLIWAIVEIAKAL